MRPQPRRGCLAHAPDALDRERVKKRPLLPRRDVQEPVRLRRRRGHLRHNLRGREADGDGEPHLLAHLGSQALGDLGRRAPDVVEPANVKERLLHREALDHRRGAPEDLEEIPARSDVGVEAGGDGDDVRTELAGLLDVHTAANAAGLGLIARGHHDARPDRHRPSAQRRIVPLLDRGKERIGVGVQDRRLRGHERMFA